jgi:hypothetical protein
MAGAHAGRSGRTKLIGKSSKPNDKRRKPSSSWRNPSAPPTTPAHAKQLRNQLGCFVFEE